MNVVELLQGLGLPALVTCGIRTFLRAKYPGAMTAPAKLKIDRARERITLTVGDTPVLDFTFAELEDYVNTPAADRAGPESRPGRPAGTPGVGR